jgi:GAF domain-containing protein
MFEEIKTDSLLSKQQKYDLLFKHIRSLTEGERDLIANLSNISSVLKNYMDGFLWAGFYFLKSHELVLGPFQGTPACVRIPLGKGVCGTAAAKASTIIVPDVNKFPGHIACSSLSRSEIVVPVFTDNKVAAVLDVDSGEYDFFDDTDKQNLEKLCEMVSELIKRDKNYKPFV